MTAPSTTEPMTAGTGACGVTTGTGLVCYLRAADGLVVLSADTKDISEEDVVLLVNDLTSQLGTE